MKRKTYIYFFVATFIIIFTCIGIVFLINYKMVEDKKEIEDKTIEEIKFVESKIVDMLNKLNNINFLNGVLVQEKITKKDKENTSENNDKNNSEANKTSSNSNESKNMDNSNSSNSDDIIRYEIKNSGILTNESKNNIDWEYMKDTVETLYSFLPTLIIDLNTLEVNSQDILKFSNTLDNVTLSIKKEDKVLSVNNLALLYSFLPEFRNKISDNEQKKNIDYCIKHVIDSYVELELNNWEKVEESLNSANNYYMIAMDRITNNIYNENKINKSYILLNELNNSIQFEDKELYFIKYKNVMEELVNSL